ncbi:hypothetical protein [Macrococcus equipercicus]|uniref:Uncharacterized protein n=1 Tax=Macrococcus equipercicus TaxID=69967 RepID=A0A9Q9BKL5_9STAP|nr:hypothetical protein [Macrococcus equipercicus]UTH13323.1 hypothetical protein KFV11_08625 [Macrococcus equipercicus]
MKVNYMLAIKTALLIIILAEEIKRARKVKLAVNLRVNNLNELIEAIEKTMENGNHQLPTDVKPIFDLE